MFRFLILIVAANFLSSCMSTNSLRATDPFLFNFQPIFFDSKDGRDYLDLAIKVFESDGYAVSSSKIFLAVTTLPVSIGKHRWTKNNDKWDLTYQIGVQIIESNEQQQFWKISHKIVGTRSGKSPRNFEPSDFVETEAIFNRIQKDLSDVFESRDKA